MIQVINFILGSLWILVLILFCSGSVIAYYFKQKKEFVIWNIRTQAEALKCGASALESIRGGYQPTGSPKTETSTPPNGGSSMSND